MPLVPAVTELIVAELLYLQYKDRNKPIFLYINSTGTTRADGETVCALAAGGGCRALGQMEESSCAQAPRNAVSGS